MIPAEYRIEGKTVLITAAARGIGKGIVKVLAEGGARVMATAMTDRNLDGLAAEMERAGLPIVTLRADATRSEEWQRTLDVAMQQLGHVDALINNLGDAITKPIVPRPGREDPEPVSDEEWRSTVDINVTEAFLGCRTFGPHFLERRNGKVINISGVSANKYRADKVVYSAMKAALERFTQTLALEWAPYGVTVNAIVPGVFPDPEFSTPDRFEASRQRARKNVPLQRVGDPREVGLLAHYLVSDASNYMTGEVVRLDGGVSQI